MNNVLINKSDKAEELFAFAFTLNGGWKLRGCWMAVIAFLKVGYKTGYTKDACLSLRP